MNKKEKYLKFIKANPTLFINYPENSLTILLNEDDIREVEISMTRELERRELPTEWAQVGIVYEDQYVYLLRDAIRFPDGALGTYIRFVRREDTVPMIVVFPLYRKRVLLVRRFRYTTRTWHPEFPSGFGAKGLSAEENAREELKKEIEASLSLLTSLGQLNLGTGLKSGIVQLFFGEIESYGNINIQEGIFEIMLITISEFERMITQNIITDGFTIATYTVAKLQGLI